MLARKFFRIFPELQTDVRYYGANATRISSPPSPAFWAWSSLTLYPHFVSSAPKSAATFTTSKNGLRQRANLANLDATIKLFTPGANPDAIPPSEPIAGPGTSLAMNCPGLRKMSCEPRQSRSRRLK
jgi:hypothetical protein